MLAPKRDGADQAIGRSRGGLGTMILTKVDALGKPLSFHLTLARPATWSALTASCPDMQADVLIAD